MASALVKLLVCARVPWNAAAFAVRQGLALPPGQPILANEDKTALFDELPPRARARVARRADLLAARYGLTALRNCSTRRTYRENLYLVHALDQVLAAVAPPDRATLRVLDVGAKNWSYVFGLHRALRHWSAREVALTGVEVDGYGLYRDGHTRAAWANAHAQQADPVLVCYVVTDFLAQEWRDLDVVTLLFPFVTRYAQIRWGLPLRYFQPAAMLLHAVQALRPGGLLLVITQTTTERDAVIRFASAAGAKLLGAQRLRSRLVLGWEATLDRWAMVWQA